MDDRVRHAYVRDNLEKQDAVFFVELGELEGELAVGLARRTFNSEQDKLQDEVRERAKEVQELEKKQLEAVEKVTELEAQEAELCKESPKNLLQLKPKFDTFVGPDCIFQFNSTSKTIKDFCFELSS